jgi:hypothetical protein
MSNDFSNEYGYIQIYTVNKDILNPEGLKTVIEWNILITPHNEYLKHTINYNNYFDITPIKNIKIYDTFRIEFEKLYCIFKNARDRILKGYIKDKTLVIYGDHELVKLIQKLPVNYDIDTVDITLKARTDFLEQHGLPPLSYKYNNMNKHLINDGKN